MNNERSQEKENKIKTNLTINSLNTSINNLLNKNDLFHDIKEIKKERKQLDISLYNKFILDEKFDKFFSELITIKIYSQKFTRKLEYFNKLISSGKEIKYKSNIKSIKDIFLKITKISIYIIKNYINTKNHLMNEKFLRNLIIMIYQEIIPVENFIFMINIFLNDAINKIIEANIIIDNQISFNNSPLFFINDLFEALVNIPKQLINNEIHIQLINNLIDSLDRELLSLHINIDLNKLDIWFKLLRNKIISYDIKNPPVYHKLIEFLVKIYKYNYQNLYFYKYFYESSAVSNDYYINSLDFLTALFKEEEKKRKEEIFMIKKGFHIYNNIPLTLDKIKWELNTYSLIFSFKLKKITNKNEDIILFSLVKPHHNKNILKFIIVKEKLILKIINAKNQEWNTNFEIQKDKDYLVCFSQEQNKNFFNKDAVYFYIIDKRCDQFKNNSFYYYTSKPNLTLELGKSNFEGIIGEVIIINRAIRPENINHLFNLKNEYGDIIPSINHRYDFTSKNKKYSNDNEDIDFFKNLKYHCILKILAYNVPTFLNDSNDIIINPHGTLQYSNTNNKNLKIRLYNVKFSIMNFAYQHGIEYLIFQFHKIVSLSENDELLNYYLYKTLLFSLEYIKIVAFFLFPSKDQKKFKIEVKYIIYVLSLLTILNTKKRKLRLDEKIKDVILKIGMIYREKNLNVLQKLNFSLLLDNRIFKRTSPKNYMKIFDEMIVVINNEGKESVLLYKDIFYKFLLLDYILESKEISHKKYMAIINFFLNGNINEYKKYNKNDNKIDNKNIKMIDIFCQYLLKIKSPIKIYHYLKVIYLNIDSIKMYTQKDEFVNFIIVNSNKIIKEDNKYNRYKQILCFLLFEEITKTENFNYTPYGFMNKPNYVFIKAIFIQCFNISNKKKLKFIKSSLSPNNEMISLKKISESNDFLSLINYKIFIPRLNSIIKYFYYLYINFLKDNNDSSLKLVLKQGIKLIFDFLDEISNVDIEDLMTEKKNNNKSVDIVLNKKKDNKATPVKKLSKQEIEKKFINDLYTSSGIKLLFLLYFNIYDENELNDGKYLDRHINFSINIIYNPFYFYLLLPIADLHKNVKKNNIYKGEILKTIINNIIIINSSNIIKNNGSVNDILVLNSILLLIKIYHIFNDDVFQVNEQLEKNIIIFLKYILENNYFYSKNYFNINLIDENVTDINNKEDRKNSSDKKDKKIKNNVEKEKDNKINKLLPEIALDILFLLLEKKEEPEIISLLYHNLKLKEMSSIFYKIDEFFFDPNYKNQSLYQYNMIKLLNSPKIITNYCSVTNANNILYTIYFFIYFLFKQEYFSKILEEKEKQNELLNLINKAVEVIFKDSINILKKYHKTIKKKNNNTSNEFILKIYGIVFEQFSLKYKDNIFINLNQAQNINNYFLNFLKTKEIKPHKLSNNFYTRTHSNNINLSFNEPKPRKGTYLEGENEENSIKEMYNIEEKTKTIAEWGRQRSSSQTCNQKPDELKNQFEQENNSNKKTTNDSTGNHFYKKEKEMISIIRKNQIITKESKNNLIISDLNNTGDLSNINNNESSENDSDNFMEDTFNCDNSINLGEEEKKGPRINKNSSSSELHFLLSPHLIVNKQDLDENNKRKATRNVQSRRELNIYNIDEDGIEIDNGYKMINEKLNKISAPNDYYQKIVNAYTPKWIRIVFNPKRALFKIFGFVFKNYIYNNRRFNKLKNAFNIKYRKFDLEMSIPQEKKYVLKYPTKLKNYICSDYYKPFLKPMLNFFENEYFKASHSFVNEKVVENDITEVDKFYKINYFRLFPEKDSKRDKKKERVRCELITNKGSIFGSIFFDNELMIFKDMSNFDNRNKKVEKSKKAAINDETLNELFFLFSSDISDRLVNTNKYVIIYYSEIKEIISRKFCLTEIAYEIFMRDGRAYYFNFYTGVNRKLFFDKLINNFNSTNYKISDKDKLYYTFDHNFINITFYNEPNLDFQKNEYRLKYLKNELTNFQYLLLVNKFSSRSYNECNQYLVFPLLYMDINKKQKRDLSKPICLNKSEIDEMSLSNFKNNYDTMGYHFNTHYASMAYVLYYLMRVIPFTFSQIKLQSGHFDVPTRLFTSLDNLLYVFSASDENRELVPEFFYSYESFLNLNYNNFGYAAGKQINHFDTNQNCGIAEFIIDSRKLLEKTEISSWINNIFGCNQFVDNYELFNRFPSYSYEQYNNFIKEKEDLYSEVGEDEMSKDLKKIIDEKIRDIKRRIQLLSLGITPSQLFKTPHPSKENTLKRQIYSTPKAEISSKSPLGKMIKKKKSNECWINKYFNDFLKVNDIENSIVLTNTDNNKIKIVFMSDNSIQLLNITSELEKDLPIIKIDLDQELILQIKPYKNFFVDLYDNVYLLCRLINKTILLCTKNQKFYIEWTCVVTALEFYSHDLMDSNANNSIHLNKIILGDEEGNISLIEIKTVYNEKKKELEISYLNILDKRLKIFYSYINGILYNKRLNIIISSCNDGIITINNAFSFEILNIIEIPNNPTVLDFKVSQYDLLYIHTKNKNDDKIYNLYCYTLNGVNISTLELYKEYINFFSDNYGISALCKDGSVYEYNSANLKEIRNHLNREDISEIKSSGEISYCLECPELKCIVVIFKKESKIIRKNNNM